MSEQVNLSKTRAYASIPEIVADPRPDDWVVEILVRVGDGQPYATKVVNSTPDPSRERAIACCINALGLARAAPGSFFIKSAKLRRDCE